MGITGMVSAVRDGDVAEHLGPSSLVWCAAAGDDAALALLDAMALRRPVAALRDGVSEMFVADGLSGSLFGPEVDIVAAHIATLLGDSRRLKLMGAAGRSKLEREFRLDRMTDGFEQAAVRALEALSRATLSPAAS
jgi:glycosyltransferase involved in cell wall biosynthesis